jgi:hypothetical protein
MPDRLDDLLHLSASRGKLPCRRSPAPPGRQQPGRP